MPSDLSVEQTIERRRSIRQFDPERPLEELKLKAILHLASFAPSSNNLQPWRFLVVRLEKNREKLRRCSFNQPKVTEAPVMVIVLGYKTPHRTDLEPMLAESVRRGAMTVEVAAETRARASRSVENVADRTVWATRSTMLAVGTLLIAAESMGVASAPMEGFEEEKVREAFGVPDDHAICCLVALGYAKVEKPFAGRFGLDHICFEEHFGQPWTLGEA